jgi:hypothetical protein
MVQFTDPKAPLRRFATINMPNRADGLSQRPRNDPSEVFKQRARGVF